MKLYYSPGACSLAAHIILNEINVDFDLERVDLKTHKTSKGVDYYEINPKGYVPALEINPGLILTVIPDITNQQTLFVEEKKIYKYKGFLKRLIKLNFKKITNYNYHIVNSNELVITTNSRVINVE